MRALMTPAKSASLLRLLAGVRELPGCVVELGVFEGATLQALAKACPEKPCYGIDTFSGLPAAAWREGEIHKPGDFAAQLEDVRAQMPSNVLLIPGLFPQSVVELNPDLDFCFAHVDFDFERSTEDAITWLGTRMVPGGLMVFDDWRWANCPGVERAIRRAGLTVVESAPCQCYWEAPGRERVHPKRIPFG